MTQESVSNRCLNLFLQRSKVYDGWVVWRSIRQELELTDNTMERGAIALFGDHVRRLITHHELYDVFVYIIQALRDGGKQCNAQA